MAAPLASVADLAAHLQRDFDAADAYTADQALRAASDLIRAHTGQTLTLVQGDTLTTTVGYLGTVVLPQRPVASVTSVIIGGSPVTWVVAPAGVLVGTALSGAQATVTYTHGYSTGALPAHIAGVCLDVAARRMENPRGLRSETVGPYSYTNDAEVSGLALTDAEKDALRTVAGVRSSSALSVDLA